MITKAKSCDEFIFNGAVFLKKSMYENIEKIESYKNSVFYISFVLWLIDHYNIQITDQRKDKLRYKIYG